MTNLQPAFHLFMQIISGSSSLRLAQKISKNKGYKLLTTNIRNFNDGELRVEVQDIASNEVIIVQSTSYPTNDNFMELLLLVDTAKRAGVQSITAVIPYFGYSRQDRCTYKYGPISVSLVAKLLETAGVTKIITLDLHSKQIEGMFNIPIINLDPATIFMPIYNNEDVVIVSPDIGGIPRARNFSSMFGKNLAIINKSRDSNSNECFMSELIGDVAQKKCIIIDDIVDGASTLCKACDLLKEKGALEIEAYVTHAVLSGDAKSKIMSSEINRIFVSDSIYHESLPEKFVTVAIDEFLSFFV